VPLSEVVDVQISSTPAAVTQQGFGIPLILSTDTRQAARVSFYTDTDGMVADGYLTTDVAYIYASSMFAQKPRPPRIAVGRMVAKPTAAFALAVAAVKNTTVYKVVVNGLSASFTSDGTATNDEIAAGVKAAIDALAQPVTTALVGVVGSQTVTITATVAGAFVSIYVDDPTLLMLTQTHADPGVAAELDAIKLYDDTWYGVVNPWNSKAMVTAIAAWVETNLRFYVATTLDGDVLSNAGGNVAATIKASSYKRTLPFYHGRNGEGAGAAWMALQFAKPPGSSTWAHKTLIGITPSKLNASQTTALQTNNVSWFRTLGGRNTTSRYSGKVASGEWADVIIGLDWLTARMQERLFQHLADSEKVSYTDAGIHELDAEIRAQLREAVTQGVLVDNANLRTVVPSAAAVSQTDRNNRALNAVKFYGDLAGAIHGLSVVGTVSA
jgi:hypothetical protein